MQINDFLPSFCNFTEALVLDGTLVDCMRFYTCIDIDSKCSFRREASSSFRLLMDLTFSLMATRFARPFRCQPLSAESGSSVLACTFQNHGTTVLVSSLSRRKLAMSASKGTKTKAVSKGGSSPACWPTWRSQAQQSARGGVLPGAEERGAGRDLVLSSLHPS